MGRMNTYLSASLTLTLSVAIASFSSSASASSLVQNLPQSSLIAQSTSTGHQQDTRPVYAVLPLSNQTGDAALDWVGIHLSENLIYQVGQQQGIRLIERQAISSVFKELALGESAWSADSQNVPGMGKILGADFLVVGSYTKESGNTDGEKTDGEKITVNLRIVSVETGEVLEGSVFQVTEYVERLKTLKRSMGRYFMNHVPTTNALGRQISEAYHQGMSAYSENRLEDAERLFNQALYYNPGFTKGYVALAQLYLTKWKRSKNPKDLAESEGWLNKFKQRGTIVPGVIFEIDFYLEQQKEVEARAVFENAISQFPDSAELIEKGLDLYDSSLSADQVLTQLKSWQVNLQNPDVQGAVGKFLTSKYIRESRDDFTTPLLLLKQAHQQQPTHQRWLLALANAYWGAEQPEKSLEYLKQIEQAGLHYPGWYLSMGNLAMLNGQRTRDKAMAQKAYAQAERYLNKALVHEPDSALLFSQLGMVYTYQKQFDKAEELLLKALAQPHLDDSVYLAIAETFLYQGKMPQAIQTLEGALKNTQDSQPLLRLVLSRLYQKDQRYDDAQAVVQPLMLSVEYKDIALKENITLAFLRKDWPEVQQAYARYAATFLENSQPKQKYRDMARIAALELRQQKESPQAAVLNDLGQLYLQRGRIEQAQTYLQQALALSPENAVIHYNMGLLHLQKKDYPFARLAFENALKHQPDYVRAAYNLVVVDIEEGKLEAARQKLLNYSAQYPDFEAFKALYQRLG